MEARTAKVGIAESPSIKTVTVPDVPSHAISDMKASIENLEEVFPRRMRGGPRVRKNKTGFRGVGQQPYGAYFAEITIGRKKGGYTKFLGVFKTKEEAARAFDKAALIVHGPGYEFFNFPEEIES